MTHTEILSTLVSLINVAGDSGTAHGYMRVLETLIQYAEHSPDATIKSTVCGLDTAINTAAYSGSFLVIDVRDTRDPSTYQSTPVPQFDKEC